MPTLATNKFAKKDYSITDTIEAGVELTGAEVKSVKLGQINLKGAYVTVDNESNVWLLGCHISAYKPAGSLKNPDDVTRKKRLLLHKKEISRLIGKAKEQGLTILPLSVYTKGSLIKIELGIGRGKKKHDKRESIKKREIDRDIRRKMKQ